MTSTTFDPSFSRPPAFDASRPWLSHTTSPPHIYGDSDTAPLASPHLDNWPVKVTIHAVDYDTMTLAATMEASNVPSQPPSYSRIISSANNTPSSNEPQQPRMSSIITYLEGEILDFRTHSFLTESFKSSTATDATYWRKLEPFASLSTEELVHKLVSRRFQAELAEKYVLMRWKERCFVRPNGGGRVRENGETWRRRRDEEMEMGEDGCGLTISGFYYVCLRRGDGEIEGLYQDPQSSPYQHLKLRPVGRGIFPVWQFR